jgi:membrane protein YdbS with pleckstrin-like domain
MTVERDSQAYAFRVIGLGRDEAAKHIQQQVRPGDALTLEVGEIGKQRWNVVSVYHSNNRIGYISENSIWQVLKPGYQYEAWAGNVEFDDTHTPIALDIEVVVYGESRATNSAAFSIENRITPMPLPYRAYPVMFRAHPFAFLVSLLLTPVIIGIIILGVWAIVSRTTNLEIDEETVRYETGVFSKDRRALNRDAIRTVRVTQSLLNRMLNVGMIEIFTAGDEPEIRAVDMYAPNEIRELLGR